MRDITQEPVDGDDRCGECGHPNDAHQLFGSGSPPVEGWIACPEPDCDCHMTWSLDPSVLAAMRVAPDETV